MDLLIEGEEGQIGGGFCHLKLLKERDCVYDYTQGSEL